MRIKQIHNYSDSNTAFSKTDRISRQKSSKDIGELDIPINLLDLIGFYRTLRTTTAKYTFIISTHEAFPKTPYTDHKTNLKFF